MKFEMKGFKDLQKRLKSMEKAASDLSGEHQIPLSELLTNSFLLKHTKFRSFAEFEELEIFSKHATFEAIPQQELDALIAEQTSFSNWSQMLSEATKEYMAKKLGLR